MTESEAIDIIFATAECESRQDKCDKDKCDECQLLYMQGTVGEHRKALQMAIQALEEIQAYRAIGTVEEIKTMMDEGAFTGVELAKIVSILREWKDYRAIGTIEEFKALKEKAEPKNWIAEHIGHGEFAWQCPTCKKYLSFMTLADGTPQDNEYNFCPKCGQAFAEKKVGVT